jgi:hypothetical protein
MPGTVDDFMQRFGGGGTMDESEAAQYHDRFTSNNPNDREFDNNTYHQDAIQYLVSCQTINSIKLPKMPSGKCRSKTELGCSAP